MWVRRLFVVLVACAAMQTMRARGALPCVGDCNVDGEVTVDEVVRGVNIALGSLAVSECAAADRDGDGAVTIDEIVAAVQAALNSCAPASPTASSSVPPTGTPSVTTTASASPSATATERPNRPPSLSLPYWYRAYAGFPVAWSVPVSDPDGDAVVCTATGVPASATWDAAGLRLVWTPEVSDAGAHLVEVRCHDVRSPSAVVEGVVAFTVSLADACIEPQCDPGVGCSRLLASLEAPCCSEATTAPAEPPSSLPCPAARAVWLSEDVDGGFQILGDCDWKFLRNQAQQAAQIRFKLRGRCFSLDDRIRVRLRMDTPTRGKDGTQPAVDSEFLVRFSDAGHEEVYSGPIPFDILGPRPYFDLQDAEANVTVQVRDALNNTASESLRLRLTFTPIPTPNP